MFLESLSMHGRDYEGPFYAVKSFCQVNFEQEGFTFPRFQVKRVDNFLSSDDVGSYVPTLNKSSLCGMNDVRQVMFDAVSKRFSNNFIDDITKAYRSKVLRGGGSTDFGNESNMSVVNVTWKSSSAVEGRDQLKYNLSCPVRCSLVEGCVEAVWSR